MSDFQRLHPVAALARAGELIRGNLLTLLAILIFGSRGEDVSFLWIFLGLLFFVLAAGTATWWRFRFRIGDGELEIHQGVWVRKELLLTRERVQVIDLSRGPIQRLFGLVRVDVKTAGSTSREARLSAVTQDVADRMAQALRSGAGETTGEEDPGLRIEEQVWKLPLRHLLLAATTSSSFGIALSLMATLLSQLDPFIQESEWVMDQLDQLPGAGRPLFWAGFLLLFIVLAWALSFFGTLIRFGNFSIQRQTSGLVIRHGLFEQKQITVPFHRIQAVRVVEGILRQPFGYLTIELDSAGYGEEREAASVVMIPLLPKRELEDRMREFLPEEVLVDLSYFSPGRARIRRLIRIPGSAAVVLAIVQWIFTLPYWIWVFWLPSWAWGWLAHKDAAIGWGKDHLGLRFRRLARTTAWVRRNRIQQLTTGQSVTQRWRALGSVGLSVASGDQGRRLRVSDLEISDTLSLRVWFTKPVDVQESDSTGSA